MTEPTNRAVKVGVFLPVTEREHGGGTVSWRDLAAMARSAEAAGFDSLWIEDHLLFRFDGQEPQGPRECWSILAALAAITDRVELGPLVSCTSYRNPALLAKIVDTVDEISGGRLILGLGAGWHEPEYAAFGYPFDHRVSRFEEALTIIHGLLRTGHVDFDGRYEQARDCELRPRGPRPAGPPLMIGSTGPRMLGLLATYGEIWNGWARQTVDDIRADRALVDAALEANGRDPATVARSVCLLVDTPMRVGRPSEPRLGTCFPTPDALAEHLLAYAAEGISHVQLWFDPNTLAGVEWAAQALPMLTRG
jgi:alkanesulfonate monooxygenase SsuD/methylene tetrahydromethanopterin reductase-like flavin-dependent oxidoreductase (luciferase family)